MNKDLFEALFALEKERGISIDFMLEKIEKAILKACKNNYNGNDDAVINVDKSKGIFDVYLRKEVVEEVSDNGKEITLLDARKIDPNTAIGEKVPIKLNTKEFGRIAAQTARNIIRQGIRDGERDQMLREFQSRLNKIVTALVEKVDPKTGAVSLRIGLAEAVLPKSECVGIPDIKENQHLKVLLMNVKEGEKGPKAMLSRTHPDFVGKLFEQEVPEIAQGIIEIKSIAREAGSRTKMSVLSNDKKIDAIGSCIGSKSSRINVVINEIRGEKIDIINYSEDPEKYIAAALSPANVSKVEIIDPEKHVCCAKVPADQLSLAIGNKGQNVRLAARLTGWKIDINSEENKEIQTQETEDVDQI